MCEYMWQICCCSSSLMLSSFAQDSDWGKSWLTDLICRSPDFMTFYNFVSASGAILNPRCTAPVQTTSMSCRQKFPMRWRRSTLQWWEGQWWTWRPGQWSALLLVEDILKSRRQWTQGEKIALLYHCLICIPINIWITKWITFICQEKGCGFLIISSNISHS